VQKFINLNCEEKKLRRKGGTWEDFDSVVRKRLKLYKDIFGINGDDMKKFRKLSEQYAKKLQEEMKIKKESYPAYVEMLQKERRKKFWKNMAVGAGAAAAVAGAGLVGKAMYTRLKNRIK
jgi:hypothetical protein